MGKKIKSSFWGRHFFSPCQIMLLRKDSCHWCNICCPIFALKSDQWNPYFSEQIAKQSINWPIRCRYIIQQSCHLKCDQRRLIKANSHISFTWKKLFFLILGAIASTKQILKCLPWRALIEELQRPLQTLSHIIGGDIYVLHLQAAGKEKGIQEKRFSLVRDSSRCLVIYQICHCKILFQNAMVKVYICSF